MCVPALSRTWTLLYIYLFWVVPFASPKSFLSDPSFWIDSTLFRYMFYPERCLENRLLGCQCGCSSGFLSALSILSCWLFVESCLEILLNSALSGRPSDLWSSRIRPVKRPSSTSGHLIGLKREISRYTLYFQFRNQYTINKRNYWLLYYIVT